MTSTLASKFLMDFTPGVMGACAGCWIHDRYLKRGGGEGQEESVKQTKGSEQGKAGVVKKDMNGEQQWRG